MRRQGSDESGDGLTSRVPTPTLEVDDRVCLYPISLEALEGLLAVFEESPEQAYEAMPWMEKDRDARPQILDFLLETSALSDLGDIHHWSIVDLDSDSVIGLIGADHMTNTSVGDFNMGYWVRSSHQGKGVARACIDVVLRWLTTCDPQAVIEITVDPHNRAGIATCLSVMRSWREDERVDNILHLEVRGGMVAHHNFLLPLSFITRRLEQR